jgi:excisionase family DNA binding protein
MVKHQKCPLSHAWRTVVKKAANDDHQGASRLVYDLWPEAGQMLGLTRNATYAAAKRGEIPVIKFGKLMKVPKAAFDRMLREAGAR